MKTSWGLPLVGVLLGLASGCTGPSDEARVASRQAIIEGEASGPGDDGVLMIRAVLEDDREVICTASLVAPSLLLTARHCVSYLTEGLFTCSLEGELVTGEDGAGQLGLHLPAEAIEVYGRERPRSEPLARGQEIISTLSETICSDDLAFVVLDTALDLPLVPIRLGRPAEFGELGMMVGFGLELGQLGIDYRDQPRLRKGDLTVAGVGPDSLDRGVTTVAPRGLIIDGPCGCIGDSGGPLLAQATGAVLGVYSLQQGESCSADNVRQHLVHVPPFERLIADAFAAVGAEPVAEPQALGGEGGEAPSGLGGTGGGAGGMGGGVTSDEPGGAGERHDGPRGADDHVDDSGCSVGASGAHRADPQRAWLALALALAWLKRLRVGRRRAFRSASPA